MARGTRVVRWLVAAVIMVAVLGAGFWAGRVTTRPAPLAQESPDQSMVIRVEERTVGRVLNLNVTASQPTRVLAANALSGVVTRVGEGGSLSAGAVLYAVNNVPVRLVAGTMPFYRPLGPGDSGQDVAQLRQALNDLGFEVEPGSTYSQATTTAVRAWQRQLGTEQTGTVGLGELVAAPSLPTTVVLDSRLLQVGATLTGGEQIVSTPTGEVAFALVLSREQAALIPSTSTVEIPHQGQLLKARIASTEQDAEGRSVLHLVGQDGGAVCAEDQCADIGKGGEQYLLSRVQVVPPATGPAVPVSAVSTLPDGSAQVQVVAKDGTTTARAVTVLGSQDGMAVVDGVRVGEQVRVFPGAGSSLAPTTAAPGSAASTATAPGTTPTTGG